MNSQDSSKISSKFLSFLNSKFVSFFSGDFGKITIILLFIVSIILFVGAHSDCWFSINCHSDPGSTTAPHGPNPAAVLVGFATTFVVASVFGAPLAVATGVGVLCWLVLQLWV